MGDVMTRDDIERAIDQLYYYPPPRKGFQELVDGLSPWLARACGWTQSGEGAMIGRVSDEWLAKEIRWYEINTPNTFGSHGHYHALRELQGYRAADTMRPEWHHTDEPDDAEQAAPDAGPKPSFVGVDLASGTDRTEIRVIRLQKRPKWLRDLLSQWERRACDLIAHGRYWDGQYLRARAEEIRKVHDERPRKPAKWERRLKRMGDTARVGPYTSNNDFVCSVGIGPDKRFYCGSTAKAAIAAAWKAWKEERGGEA